MEHSRPDVTVLNRAAWECTFVDFTVPWDKNVGSVGRVFEKLGIPVAQGGMQASTVIGTTLVLQKTRLSL